MEEDTHGSFPAVVDLVVVDLHVVATLRGDDACARGQQYGQQDKAAQLVAVQVPLMTFTRKNCKGSTLCLDDCPGYGCMRKLGDGEPDGVAQSDDARPLAKVTCSIVCDSVATATEI